MSAVIAVLLATAAMRAEAKDVVLLVGGMGGEPRYTKQFTDTLQRVRAALIEKHHYAADDVHLMTEEGESATAQAATLDSLRAELGEIARGGTADDTLLVMLMGHGQSDYVDPKFNLTGPDLDAVTLNQILAPMPMRDIRLILSFPCAGHFSEFLRDPRFSVVAAGDGPRQIYLCAMNTFVAKAFEDDLSDGDGDGVLTFKELYEFLSQEVDNYYQSQQFLQLENVSLEDNGDGRVTTRAEGMDAGDGDLSSKRRIAPAPAFKPATVSEEAAR